MEENLGNEIIPVEKRRVFAISIKRYDPNESSSSSEERSSNEETEGQRQPPPVLVKVKQEVSEGLVPLFPLPPQDVVECIILSSDEEVEEDEDNHGYEVQPQQRKLKRLRRSLPPKVFSVNRSTADVPVVVRDSVQDKTEEREGVRDQIICSFCGIKLRTNKALKNHIEKSHDVGSGRSSMFKCGKCEKEMPSKKSLGLHQKVHSSDRFPCNLCHVEYKYGLCFLKHLNSQQHKNLSLRSLQKTKRCKLISGDGESSVMTENDAGSSQPPSPLLMDLSGMPVLKIQKTAVAPTRGPSGSAAKAESGTSTRSPPDKPVPLTSKSSWSRDQATTQTPSHSGMGVPVPIPPYNFFNGETNPSMFPSMIATPDLVMFHGYMVQYGTPIFGNGFAPRIPGLTQGGLQNRNQFSSFETASQGNPKESGVPSFVVYLFPVRSQVQCSNPSSLSHEARTSG